MAKLEIPEDVIEKVVAALNRAIALATRFEPLLTAGIMEAACELDDAISDAMASEE
jgi:hypothetical protein